jgi:hypothetical protein
MKRLVALLFLWAGTSLAQSPFDGTWITNWNTVQFAATQTEYLAANGKIQCTGWTARPHRSFGKAGQSKYRGTDRETR